YDDGELKFASRIRFLLAHFGVQNADLVNSGFAGMQPLINSGAIKLQAQPSVAVPATFAASDVEEPIAMVYAVDVVAVLNDPAVKLLDVRTPAEFHGTDLIPPDTRGGHI